MDRRPFKPAPCMSKKHKIRPAGDYALGANPFAALDRSGLPKGEMKSSVTLSEQKSMKEKSKGRVEVRLERLPVVERVVPPIDAACEVPHDASCCGPQVALACDERLALSAQRFE